MCCTECKRVLVKCVRVNDLCQQLNDRIENGLIQLKIINIGLLQGCRVKQVCVTAVPFSVGYSAHPASLCCFLVRCDRTTGEILAVVKRRWLRLVSFSIVSFIQLSGFAA